LLNIYVTAVHVYELIVYVVDVVPGRLVPAGREGEAPTELAASLHSDVS